jgi:hypothetical protein
MTMRDPQTTYVTLSGLPVRIELEWPFHLSTSGADWYSLHGRIWLDDGGPLHADVAVNLTQVIKEALPSLEPEYAEAVVVNALRKQLDLHQLELLKSGKRQPVAVSSRHYDFRNQRLIFQRASDESVLDLLRCKAYWTAARHGRDSRAWLADPFDALYLNLATDHLLKLARVLEQEGLIRIDGAYATATDALMLQAREIEEQKEAGLKALEAKHAFERG